jgi:hypothetical protein
MVANFILMPQTTNVRPLFVMPPSTLRPQLISLSGLFELERRSLLEGED